MLQRVSSHGHEPSQTTLPGNTNLLWYTPACTSLNKCILSQHGVLHEFLGMHSLRSLWGSLIRLIKNFFFLAAIRFSLHFWSQKNSSCGPRSLLREEQVQHRNKFELGCYYSYPRSDSFLICIQWIRQVFSEPYSLLGTAVVLDEEAAR